MRRYCRSSELCRWLKIDLDDLRRFNPDMDAVDEMFGTQLLLVPTRVSPADVPKDLCELKPWPHRMDAFRTYPRKRLMQDPFWQPPEAPFQAILGRAAAEAMWGRFAYRDATGDDITITDGWDRQNIGNVAVPGLRGVPGATGLARSGMMQFNKKCHRQVIGLWSDWERHGLIRNILTFDGAFVPRYKRQSTHVRDNLSNHAWGTAFDINAAQNALGQKPAALGKAGSVMDMVELAYKWGFYWGGYFKRGRFDGMHFEVAKLL